jgi:hypothetical protein
MFRGLQSSPVRYTNFPPPTKVFSRHHNQVPRISFSNLDTQEPTRIPWDVRRNREPSLQSEVNSALSISHNHSMSRIDLNKFDIKDKDSAVMDIYKIPSWYERLSTPSTYRIHEDIINTSFSVPYRSFDRCYSRVLSYYFDAFLPMNRTEMEEKMAKLPNQDIPVSLQRQIVKVKAVERKLSQLSLNTYCIYKRLETPRDTPPFHLYQPFSIYLAERDIGKLLDAYFKLPSPRPQNIKREDFEIFMSLLLGVKASGDHDGLISQIVEVFEDIRKNGDGILLTPFENTKYLSLLLLKWRQEGVSQENKFKNVLKMKNNNYLKGEENIKLQFSPAMWDIMVSHFPEFGNEIMMMMANETGLSRLTAGSLIKCLTTYDELCNALDLMKLKNYHMDSQLFDIVLEKHLELGRVQEAWSLLENTMQVFKDISELHWKFLAQKYSRATTFKYDSLNKTLQQLRNENVDQPISFSWLQYKFKPSPFIIGKLAFSLDLAERSKLFKMMIEQNIPLVNKHSMELLEQQNFTMLSLILKLTNNSVGFNKDLHAIASDARYDTNYYKSYLYHPNGVCFELLEIFRRALDTLRTHSSNGGSTQLENDASNEIKSLKIILEKESENIRWK